MATRRRYTKREKAAAVVNAELSNAMAAAEATGIPETTIRYWLDAPEFAGLRAKTREEAASGFTVLMHRAQERLEKLIPTMDARDLITLMGVATDKAQLLSGAATVRTETTILPEFDDHESAALVEVAREEIRKRAEVPA